jgi:RNA polymerase sigma-70 factor, ECF subfamily
VTATLTRFSAVGPVLDGTLEQPALDHQVATAPAATGPHVLDAAVLGDHLDRLYRAALGMCGSRADAEDLVQEACVRVLSKPRIVRDQDVAYLLGVLHNTFVTRHREQLRQRTTPSEPSSLANVSAGRRFDPELGLFAREIHQAIAELPDHYRDAVIAVDILGLSYADAALALGVPAGTIMSRLYRGRDKVAARVGEPPDTARWRR